MSTLTCIETYIDKEQNYYGCFLIVFTNLQFHLMKCSSRFWGPHYSTSLIIVCYQIMQRFNNDRMIAHKISYIDHCAQKALQLFAHSGYREIGYGLDFCTGYF